MQQDQIKQSLRRTRRRISSWLFPAAVFVLSTSMTIGIYAYLDRQEKLEWKTSVARDAALVTSEIRDRLRAHAQFLRGVRAFFSASDEVSPAEWDSFARQLQIERNVPGIQAYGFAPMVQATDLPAFAAEHKRRTKLNEFRIAPLPKPQGTALPIIHIAPDTAANQAALGFNIYSEARRMEAVDLARDRNDVALSRRIELVQEGAQQIRQPGLLMLLPVYKKNMPTSTFEERQHAFAGVVFAAYRMGDFMQSFNYANSGSLGLRIFDEDSFNSERTEQTLSLLYDTGVAKDAPVVDEREMDFGQRNWHLRYTALDNSGNPQGPLSVLFAGFLVSALLAMVSRTQTSYRERAERLAREMTIELRLSEERFKLAAEGTSDGIWDRDLEKGTVWHSDRLKQILGFPAETDTANVEFFLARIHPDDRSKLDLTLQQHYRDRQPYHVEYRFRKGDGEWAWFRSHGQGVWSDDGKIIRLVGSISDISAQRESELKVAQYRDFLATVLKFIPHP
ncbi:MAG: hypothetical protein QG572_502, partial [Pseudomonadota bacterium]|nr:hypothetical protein [Pseudomonadota bacterium]